MREPERTAHGHRFVQEYQPCIVYIESYPTLTPQAHDSLWTHQVYKQCYKLHTIGMKQKTQ